MNMQAPTPEPMPGARHRAAGTRAIPRRTRLVWRRKALIELALSALIVLLTAALVIVLVYVWLQGMTDELPPCTDWIAEHGGMCSGPIINE